MAGILTGLNDAQKAAVLSDASVLQVLAPPGSGKTKTLTTRVAHLISERQLRPWNIIVCTFTVKAAREMKDRIRGFVGEGLEKKLILGTFHSVALRYLKAYGHQIGLAKDFAIADTSDSKAILRRIIKLNGYTIEPGAALSRISAQKAKGIDSRHFSSTATHIEQQEFSRVYSEYESTLAASKLLDYDDLLLRCRLLLRSHPECVANVEAVLIDEFQDTNNIQYDLMALFAQRRNQITIVGDPDQSIYGFRSAEIKNLGRMKTQWSDTLTINLTENYRSSGAILHAAQKIIEQDDSRPAKKLQPTHGFGLRPVLRKLPTAYAEAEWLVSEIKRCQALTGAMLQPKDFAVLLRSAALSRPIESAMGKAGVPYRMVGGTKFYERAEIKILVDYLRVVDQPHHGEALERVINVPSRHLGETSVKSLQEGARQKGTSLWKHILDISRGATKPSSNLSSTAHKGLSQFVNVVFSLQQKIKSSTSLSLADLLHLLIKKIGFQDYLKAKYGEDHETRWSNVEEFFVLAAEASSPEQLARVAEEEALPTVEGVQQRPPGTEEDMLSSFLANIALTAAADQKAESSGQITQQVVVSTIHAAKGLEWPVVFIPACYEGSIPHSRAEDNDEERRLLYVGMTRAQAVLYLSCPTKNTQKSDTTMSTFLTQPGVSAFFDDRGPSIPRPIAHNLATTLRRDCPNVAVIAQSSVQIKHDEDDQWPLDGEERSDRSLDWESGRGLVGETAGSDAKAYAGWAMASSITLQNPSQFSAASTTMGTGFVSAASRYTEELEKRREESTLRKVDSRVSSKQRDPEIKGRKRHIEGQSSISGFFGKKSRSEIPVSTPVTATVATDASRKSVSEPFADITNTHTSHEDVTRRLSPLTMASHKARTAPLNRAAANSRTSRARQDPYVFLSSSPTKPEDTDETKSESDTALSKNTSVSAPSRFKPASTFHTTSMQRLDPTGRKTLGVRRSMNGWANRTHK